MRLATFLRQSSDEIVAHSVAFAGSLAPLSNQGIDIAVLRNHLPLVLEAIWISLRRERKASRNLKDMAMNSRERARHKRMAECGPTQD